MNTLKTSIRAVGIGLFAELITRFILTWSIFLFFGAKFGIAPFISASGPVLLSNFAGGFVSAFYAERYRWLHSVAAFFLSQGISLIGMLGLLRTNEEFLSQHSVPVHVLESMVDFMEYLLAQPGVITLIIITVFVYLLGAILVYLIVAYARIRIRNAYKALNLVLQIWGGALSFVGLILYAMAVFFVVVFGIIPLMTPSAFIPLSLLVIAGGLYWTLRNNNLLLGTIVPVVLITNVIRVEGVHFLDALSSRGPSLMLSFLTILVMLGGSYIWRYGQRIFSLGGVGDINPEIIILRSFEDDRKSIYSFFERFWRWLTLRDHFLVMVLSKWCRKSKKRVSVVSNPADDLPSWSGRMVNFDDDWLESVTTIIKRCELIVVVASASKGLLQEVQVVGNTGKFDRLIVVVPKSISADDLDVFENSLRQNGADIYGKYPGQMAMAIADSDAVFSYVELYDKLAFLTVIYDKLEEATANGR